MHKGGHLRDPSIDAFENGQYEWLKEFETVKEAYDLMGKLWTCTDVVPASVRDEVSSWLEGEGIVGHDEARELRRGCTYAQLARRIRSVLRDMSYTPYTPYKSVSPICV